VKICYFFLKQLEVPSFSQPWNISILRLLEFTSRIYKHLLFFRGSPWYEPEWWKFGDEKS
jgi:hypothetical protein